MRKYETKNRSLAFQCLALAAWALLFSAISLSPLNAAFKDEGWGARPLGMGGAFTSVADDANAPMFNAAGIAQLKKTEFTFTHARLYTGLDLNGHQIYSSYASFARPTEERGTFGFSWANQTVSELYQEHTFSANYAHSLNQYFIEMPFEGLVGMNLKYLYNSYTLDERSRVDPVFRNGRNSSAVSFDFGVLLNFSRNAFGVNIKNINSPNVGLVLTDRVPREFAVGFSRYFYNIWIFEEAFPSLDIVYRDEVDPDMHARLGAEGLLWKRHITVRMGAEHSRAFTMGFGYNTLNLIPTLELSTDYAFVLPLTIESTSGSHRFSVTARFDGPKFKQVAKALTPEVQKGKVDAIWQMYVDMVQSGGSLDERRRFLKKFINKYRYSGQEISFAEQEYEAVLKQIEDAKKAN